MASRSIANLAETKDLQRWDPSKDWPAFHPRSYNFEAFAAPLLAMRSSEKFRKNLRLKNFLRAMACYISFIIYQLNCHY